MVASGQWFRPERPRALLARTAALLVLVAPVTPADARPLFEVQFAGYPAVQHPTSAFVLDADHDGRADVVALNAYTPGAVSVFPGLGDRTLGTRQDYALGHFPLRMAVGDLNGDGWFDAVTANRGEIVLSILMGAPGGHLGSEQLVAVPEVIADVSIGDMNGDGRPDLVAGAATSSKVYVLLGLNGGGWGAPTPFATGGVCAGLRLADLNQDGARDVVTANWTSGTLSVLYGTGNGTLASKEDHATGMVPGRVAVADVNGDGRLDLVAADPAQSRLGVLLRTAEGGYFSPTYLTLASGSGALEILVADFNADGRLDIGCTYDHLAGLSVLIGNGGGLFPKRVDIRSESPGQGLAIGDLDADGKPEAIVSNTASVSVAVYSGDVTSTKWADRTPATAGGPSFVAAGDFNADARADLAVANTTSGSVSILPGRGDGTFGTRLDIPTGPAPVGLAVGDFNHDGRDDLAVADSVALKYTVLLANGAGGFARVDHPLDGASVFVIAADLDLDGALDLAFSQYAADHGAVALGIGNGGFAPPVPIATGVNPLAIYCDRFNADPWPDLIALNGSFCCALRAEPPGCLCPIEGGTISVLPGTGDSQLFSATLSGYIGGPRRLATADFNGDGRRDFVVSQAASQSITTYLGTASGWFAWAADRFVSGVPVDVIVHDFDLDGVLDATVVDRSSGALTACQGTGAGTFGAPYRFAAGAGAISEAIADFDHDGRMDVAVANRTANTVSILMNVSTAPVVPVQTSLVSATATPGRARIIWFVGGADVAETRVRTLRRDKSWADVASLIPDGTGYVHFDADGLSAGAHTFCLWIREVGQSEGACYGQVEILIPETLVMRLEQAARGTSAGRVELVIELPIDGPAKLSLFDMSGRRVAIQQLKGIGAGTHTISITTRHALPAGLYMARLEQATRNATGKVLVLN